MTTNPFATSLTEVIKSINDHNDLYDMKHIPRYGTSFFSGNTQYTTSNVINYKDFNFPSYTIGAPYDPSSTQTNIYTKKGNAEIFLSPASFSFTTQVEAIDLVTNLLTSQAYANNSENMDRFLLSIGQHFLQLVGNYKTTLEYLAWQALITGKIVISGKGITSVNVDFERENTHSFTPSTWSNPASSTPIDDLTKATDLIYHDGKIVPDMVIMGRTAFDNFMKSNQIKTSSDLRRIDQVNIGYTSSPKELEAKAGIGVRYHGSVSTRSSVLDIYTYEGSYTKPSWFGTGTGVENFLGDNTVLVLPSNLSQSSGSALVYTSIPRFAEGQSGTSISIIGGYSVKNLPQEYSSNAWISSNGRILFMELVAKPLPILGNSNATAVLSV